MRNPLVPAERSEPDSTNNRCPVMAVWQKGVEKAIVSALDDGSRLQAPAVASYVDKMRRAHPEESPAQIITRLEKLYLNAVTGSGGAVGATAAIPGVGTMTALSAAGAETIFFLEASALFTLAVAAVHGITPEQNEQRRALVLAVVLGESGAEIVQRAVGRKSGSLASQIIKIPGLAQVNDSLLGRFAMRFVLERSALMVGKVIPAGIGAAIGGFGNRALGKAVVNNARNAFGAAPAFWTGVIVDQPARERLKP